MFSTLVQQARKAFDGFSSLFRDYVQREDKRRYRILLIVIVWLLALSALARWIWAPFDISQDPEILPKQGLSSVVSTWLLEISQDTGDPFKKLNTLAHVKQELHTLKQAVAQVDEALAFATINPAESVGSLRRELTHFKKEISIPFYVYDEPEIRAFESICRFDRETEQGFGGHMSEYYAAALANNHRWRVQDPNKALIFLVPVYLGAALEGACVNLETGMELIKNATRVLQNSTWFQRFGGNDHLFVGTHWRVFNWFREDKAAHPDLEVWNKLIWGRNLVAFEDTFCIVLVPYSTRPIDVEPIQETNVATFLNSRPYSFFFMGRVFQEHHAHGYATRRAVFNGFQGFRGPNVIVSTIQPINFQIPNCEPLQEPPNASTTIEGCYLPHNSSVYDDLAAKSMFHLMIRGDDWSSQRLYDIIRSGGIPVILSDGLWDKVLPFGCDVDWDSFVIRIPEKEFAANPLQSLQKYIPDLRDPRAHEDLQRRLRVMKEVEKHLLWSHPSSAVFDNVLRGAVQRCFPEAHLLRSGIQGFPDSPAPRSLQHLTCPFRDYSKNRYVPSRHGVGYFQDGWNQDD